MHGAEVQDAGRNLSLAEAWAEASARYIAENPASRAAHEAAALSMPGGNTRTVLHYDPFPLAIAQAEGARLTDADGHGYTDFLGEYTAGLYGHSHPVIRAAITGALDRGILAGGPNGLEAPFAEAIRDRFPAIERLRFCNSGTEANLFALSVARAVTGRGTVAVIEGGYHGGVFFFAGENPLNVPMPFLRLRYNDCDGARAALRAAADDLAAVIVEPMLGGGGCIPASREFLATLAEEARASGALLVFDEVMTSRLAPGGLHGLHRLRPDLVTLGKYVGGGMSFGAFGGRADLMAHFDPFRPGAWPHAGTFNNNVLTMSAGLAGLTRIYTPEAMARLNAQGEALRADLGARMARADIPVVLTGIGSMMAWHVARTPPACPQDLADLPAELRALLHLDLIARGFYVARRGMIVLSLPMTAADTAAFAEAFEEVMRLRRGLILAALG